MTTAVKQPAVFFAHGAGPLPLLGHHSHTNLIKCLKGFAATLREAPKAILIVSAHWEVCRMICHEPVQRLLGYLKSV